MDKKWFEQFQNRAYWDDLVQTYLKTGTAPGKSPYSHVEDLWEYFKYCILTDNRFFFNHPLVDAVKTKICDHAISLSADATLFRARIDNDNTQKTLAESLIQEGIFSDLAEKHSGNDVTFFEEMIADCKSIDGFEDYRKQHQRGFEGFPADECLSPPAYITSGGRCNLPNSPHLYAAKDIHTAIAETRPFIYDTISVASICCKRDLRIADFCYSRLDFKILNDLFYLAICSEFSQINKGRENDYFATQYLTLLVKALGYDGLRFKSSLVHDGVNYVIFDDSVCKPLSSKLYTVARVRYDIVPESKDSSLIDSHGAVVSNPPLSRCKNCNFSER